MRIAITGADGQLGSDLTRLLREQGAEAAALTQPEFELTRPDSMRSLLGQCRPGVILNTAAYVAVEEAEEDAETAFRINAIGTRSLARIAAEIGCWLVHFSTDYVFDGTKEVPYSEEDPPRPLNVYGNSKLAGEYFVRAATPKHLIVRSAGLYGAAGPRGKAGNFVDLVIARARAGETLRVVSDQVTAPTYTRDLAEATLALVERALSGGLSRSGIYHITNGGSCSWYEFASEALRLAGVSAQVVPVTTAELGAKAARPGRVILANSRLRALGISQPRPWAQALRAYLEEKGCLG